MKVCSSPNCGHAVYKDQDLCKRHYAYKIWKRNEYVDNDYFLGIILFFQACLPRAFKGFKYGIPRFHKEILWEVHRDEPGWTLFDRQVVIAAPRGSSKTTLLTKAYVLYCILFGIKRYIVIASKTARQAEKILRFIKASLGNKTIIAFFGDLRPDARGKRLEIDVIEGKWTSNLIILKNGVTVETIGMNQAVRSAAEGEDADRIDLFIADDAETDDNTRTPERRENNETWLFDQILPAMDIDTGTIVFIGTMTHTECLLNKLLHSKTWRKRRYQVTFPDENGKEVALWEEKFSLKRVEQIHNAYKDVGRERGFYKEYYNIIRSSTGISERWIRFWVGNTFRSYGADWLELQLPTGEKIIHPAHTALGVDLQFSKKFESDWTVIIPVSQIDTGNKYIHNYFRGKTTNYDDIDNGKVVKTGFVSEILRYCSRMPINVIVVGVEGQQMGYYDLIVDEVGKRYPGILVLPYQNNTMNKIDRIKAILQNQYESGRMYHKDGMDDLLRELLSLGDTTDDIVDALSMAITGLQLPKSSKYHYAMGSVYSHPTDRPKPIEHNWMVL
jgi:hypothetical protein